MNKNWPEIVDMECINIEKDDILVNGNGDYIIASEKNLNIIDDGINWRVVGLLQKGETLKTALKRINRELL